MSGETEDVVGTLTQISRRKELDGTQFDTCISERLKAVGLAPFEEFLHRKDQIARTSLWQGPDLISAML